MDWSEFGSFLAGFGWFQVDSAGFGWFGVLLVTSPRVLCTTAKVIPTQKWSPRCDGLVHRLYAVQDSLCYCVMHRTDKIQVSLKNCSKCLCIIDFTTIYILASIQPSGCTCNHKPFSLPTRLPNTATCKFIVSVLGRSPCCVDMLSASFNYFFTNGC